MKIHNSWGSRLFDSVNISILVLFALITFLPFIYIIGSSFTATEQYLRSDVVWFPTQFSLDGYRYIFSTKTIVASIGISVYVTVFGTLLNLVMTSFMAYPLSKRDPVGRRYLMGFIVFSMLFSGGMIPTYLIVKNLGILNSLWSLLLPVLISAFNLIIIKNFFQQIPEELEEASKIDGCSDLGVLFRIIIPLSKPVLATFAMFYAVAHWNTFFNAILYINDTRLWPVQVWLRQVVITSSGGVGDLSGMESDFIAPPANIVKMGVIVVATLPILIVYPFLQKHFAKGVLLGSVKG